ALRVLDDDAGDPVARVVVIGAERSLEPDEYRPVLPGEADDHDRLPAAHEPVHRRAGRVLARVVAVVVVVVARVHPLKDRGDRDGIEAGIVAPIELPTQVEDRLRGEWVFARRVVLDDPAAGRRAGERLPRRILELGDPLHVGRSVAPALQAVSASTGA